ncbi:hypothetical protein BKA65DRAFT_597938 [Rhexocercosporidium sp. MPI-PUGE-AT-0058]|nr:hypothetical protein BKA65DRAFT_597938 [Rhexocercosporidium sp. MPI-PUGE-AT-0058]
MSKQAAPNLREGLLECLSNIEPSGSSQPFAVFDTLQNPINPGVSFTGGPKLGFIGLPLSDGDAEVVRAAGIPLSATGKSNDDGGVLTSTPPGIWEVPANMFELRNPAWAPFLQGIVNEVAAGLGVDATGTAVSARLSKLCLYDEGAMLEPLQDSRQTSTVPGMFGTLVIALPSRHEGGDALVTNASESEIKAYSTAATSSFDSSFMAWFHDATHALKPVTAGRRLTLTYCLFHENLGPDVLAASSNKTTGKLDMLFSSWKSNAGSEVSYLGYLLTEKYHGKSELSYDVLEGVDQEVVKYLRDAGSQHGVCIYLANLSRWIDTYDDYDDWGEYDSGKYIDQESAYSALIKVVELDGTVVAENLLFGDDVLVQDDAFEDEEPDDDLYQESRVVYYRTVALIMPKESQLSCFMTPTGPITDTSYYGSGREKGPAYVPDVTGWIDRLTARILTESGEPEDVKDLETICQDVLSRMKGWKTVQSNDPPPYPDADLGRVIAACVELDKKEMFLEGFELGPANVPSSMFKLVGNALVRWDLAFLLPQISKHLSVLSQLASRFDIINALKEGVSEEIGKGSTYNDSLFQEWTREEADKAVSADAVIASGVTSASDGVLLANYCATLAHSAMVNKILPVVKRNVKFTAMTISFQLTVFQASVDGQIPTDVVREIFGGVISTLLPNFGLRALGAAALEKPDVEPPKFESIYCPPPLPIVVCNSQRINDIASLLCHCHSLGLSQHLDVIVSNLATEASTTGLDDFRTIFLAFLKTLGATLRKSNIAVQRSPFQALYQHVMSTYIERYVQQPPNIFSDWTRETITCRERCKDCDKLNDFLSNPRQQAADFLMGGPRREHLLSKVRDTGIEADQRKKYPSGSAYALFLTKNTAYIELGHKAWENRREATRESFRDIESEANLHDLLADLYVPIMAASLPHRGSINGLAPLGLAGNGVNRILPPGPRGTKRKATETIVIDD